VSSCKEDFVTRHGPVAPPRLGQVAWLDERLSDRDLRIIESVNRLRLVQGVQLERLHFHELTPRGRVVARGKVLRRLVAWQVLTTLDRRIGGSPRGSSGLVYGLGSGGRRLLRDRAIGAGATPRIRPGMPGERLVRHTLAIAELYVALVEQCRAHGVQLAVFEAERPVSNGMAGFLTPDAYAALTTGPVSDYWWVEVDLASESVSTLRGKFLAYIDFAARGQLGPDDVLPRVLVTVPDVGRRDVLRRILARLPDPANRLLTVALHDEAAQLLVATALSPDGTGSHV
jgi:hypothetical protein